MNSDVPKCPAEDDEGFALANDAPKSPARRFDNGDATRQRALIDGLDCLPGQLDLF